MAVETTTEIVELGSLLSGSFRGYALPAERKGLLSLEPARFRMVSIADFAGSGLVPPSRPCHLDDLTDLERGHMLAPGDVLVARVGRAGDVVLVGDDADGLVAGENLLVLRPDASLVEPGYLAAYLGSPWGQRAIDGLRGGRAGALSKRPLLALGIPMPPAKVRTEIAQRFEEESEKMRRAAEALAQAKAARKSLLDETLARSGTPA